MPVFLNKRSVRRYIDLEPFAMAGIQQLIDFGMEEGFAFDVKINMIRMRFDLIQDVVEGVQLDEISFASRLRTEAAGQIAYACNFDIYLFERFQDFFPILYLSVNTQAVAGNDLIARLILYCTRNIALIEGFRS